MTEAEALRRVRAARHERDRAERARKEARSKLAACIRAAQAAGVPVTRIAREVEMSRQGVYDLLAAEPPP